MKLSERADLRLRIKHNFVYVANTYLFKKKKKKKKKKKGKKK